MLILAKRFSNKPMQTYSTSLNTQAAQSALADLDPDRHRTFVLIRSPPLSYAGQIGDEAIVVDRTADSVYVLFRSGIRECYPPHQFSLLFRLALAAD